MNATSPFGKYAALVAAIAAIGILGAWLLTATRAAGMMPSPELNAVALVVVGAIFGTGAGALVVANGVGRQAAAANTRLDAMHAPSGPTAAALVKVDAADSAAAVAASEADTPPRVPPDYPGTGT